jgi:tRNA dimethylallyltransferase
VKPNPRLREVLSQWSSRIGPAELHSKLAILDPQAADSIDCTNVRRTIRALEVILLTGKRFSDQKASGYRLYESLLLGLTRPRVELYQRIDERITNMIDSGFIDEVHRLLEAGYALNLPTLSAIGYGEISAFIQGEITLDEAILLIKRRTRTFVRRQANWFKDSDPGIHWFQVSKNTIEEMEILIEQWLVTINYEKKLSELP